MRTQSAGNGTLAADLNLQLKDGAGSLAWLERMGVIAVDEDGDWSLTDLGKGAMARFQRSCMPVPAGGRSRHV
jgi:hypothetical protein